MAINFGMKRCPSSRSMRWGACYLGLGHRGPCRYASSQAALRLYPLDPSTKGKRPKLP